MDLRTIVVQRSTTALGRGCWRAVVERTTGALWWKKSHRIECVSDTGIVWRRTDYPAWVDAAVCRPPLEAVVRMLEDDNLDSWQSR